MPVTFYRTGPFPRCRYCGEPMDYWIIGQRDEDACHPECAAKAIADEFIEDVRKAIRPVLREEKCKD